MENTFIIDTIRTPRGKGKAGKGALNKLHPQELLAQTLSHLTELSGIPNSEVEDVIVGCVSQVEEQGANIARNAVLSAGFPETVTGVTLNRFCGSGLQAVNFAAASILSGMQHVMIGGGVESMSRYPLNADGGGTDGWNQHLRKRIYQVPQGISADLIATIENFSREELDSFSLASQKKAANAQSAGYFEKSLFPVRNSETGEIILHKDEILRPDTTLEGLLALPPSFTEVGKTVQEPIGKTWDQIALSKYSEIPEIKYLHTAGNSSALSDGAAAVLLASETFTKAHGLKPRARIRAIATAGSEPVIMLTAPTPAIKKVLSTSGMSISNIDLWEINEAFAAVPLQIMRALKIDPDRVNVNGGSIALGHPLGATGAILLGTALDELERRNLSTALITLCIAGGQAVATIIERV
ncbi:acetyl-CoA C-acyltransferase [Leptospira fainei serovar Hurstbridge str. BUT 6]|uniref:Acetyl-CoA C-acyltransferase n=1 Tax=Leptospira fainei serovar Hurstbridge str. BUT 6 TaxID=1193011 RepID=S3UZT7_9LEPT|nr:acetyl-CoA C-acetyltransferase [Leptospira fainei]EPG75936.1 acetyl-CoA C-acyltransferase [Leptospira fainei serovar Hurstbridge str. BUT 6]